MNQEKLRQLRGMLQAQGVDALVSSKSDNLFYLSGFECSQGYAVITRDRTIIAADSRYDEWARTCLPAPRMREAILSQLAACSGNSPVCLKPIGLTLKVRSR